MPNHVTHRVIITGLAENIAKFHETFFTEENQGFDFETILPMPEILKGTEMGSLTSIGLYLLGHPSDIIPENYLTYQWVKDAGVTTESQLRAYLEERYPTAISVAQQSIEAIEQTDYSNWYDWSIVKWGTKWNAYHCDWDPTTGCLKFDTAWNTPEGIWVALANRPEVQNLRIEIDAFDEGWCFAYHAVIEDGIHEGSYVETTPEMYETVYGEAPELEDEE